MKKLYHKGPEKKFKELKRDIIEIQSQQDNIKKVNIRKILCKKKNMEKAISGKSWTEKIIWKKEQIWRKSGSKKRKSQKDA